jgi:hypothetical protein
MTLHPRKIAGQRPITAKSPPPEVKAAASRRGGAVARERKHAVLTPAEKWQAALPEVLDRFRESMNERYADEDPLGQS